MAAAALIAIIVMWNISNAAVQAERERNRQELNTILMLQEADTGFYQQMSIEERANTEDGIYYTGVIGDELDAMLDELVDSYNEDPSRKEYPVTIAEVRYCLTEGLVEAAENENRESSFRRFLKWTGIFADLAYRWNKPDEDGTVHSVGEPAPTTLTNYYYILGKDLYSDYDYSWSLEQTS